MPGLNVTEQDHGEQQAVQSSLHASFSAAFHPNQDA